MDRPWYKLYEEYGIDYKSRCEDKTYLEFFEDRVKAYSDKPFLIFEGKSLSYRDVDRESSKFASFLITQGVLPGDKVVVLFPNTPHIVIAMHAIWKVGGVFVGLNPLYTKRELLYQINNCKAQHVVILDLFAKKVLSFIEETRVRRIVVGHIRDYLPFHKKVISLITRNNKVFRKIKDSRVLEWNSVVRCQDELSSQKWCRSLDNVATMIFTGGTTGVQKAAVRSHRVLSFALQMQLRFFEPLSKQMVKRVMLNIAPIYHIYGAEHGPVWAAYVGGTSIMHMIPKAVNLLRDVEKYKITSLQIVPSLLQEIIDVQRERGFDLSSLLFLTVAAGKISDSLYKESYEVLGVYPTDAYGMTEACTLAAGFWVDKNIKPVKDKATGIPLPGVDMRIVDIEDSAKILPYGSYGEIQVRGVNVMSGYYNMPGETGLVKSEDGWLLTGDCGLIDEDGWLFILGRKKEMVSVKGFKVYAREIEDLLDKHPKVKEGCMVGAALSFGDRGKWDRDPENDEVVKVVIVKDDESLTEGEVKQYFKENVSPYKVPREVVFVDNLPRDFMGKVQKKFL